MPKLPQVVSKI